MFFFFRFNYRTRLFVNYCVNSKEKLIKRRCSGCGGGSCAGVWCCFSFYFRMLILWDKYSVFYRCTFRICQMYIPHLPDVHSVK